MWIWNEEKQEYIDCVSRWHLFVAWAFGAFCGWYVFTVYQEYLTNV